MHRQNHRDAPFRWLLTLSLALVVGVVPGLARACPFCSAVSLTFSQEIDQSAAAVVARLVTPPPASALGPLADGPLPKGIFEVDQGSEAALCQQGLLGVALHGVG